VQSLILSFFIFITYLFLPVIGQAATLVLQTGEKVEGDIIERTPLRIMLDMKGNVETFYIGEILSIDGQKMITPPNEGRLTIAKEEASMTNAIKASKTVVAVPSPKPAPLQETLTIPQTVNVPNKDVNVVPTPDGGIIVVTPTKITKYTKDLQLVKQVNCTN